MSFLCPVCGYPHLEKPPRGEATGGSYEICPSCGFEFGVSDDDKGFTYELWRAKWIEGGMNWYSVLVMPPKNWDPSEQLDNLVA